MGKIAFSYIRMSTKQQLHGDSRRRQIERSKKYAEERGYDLKDTIEDIGVSAYRGKNFEDGELGRFIQAAKDGQIDLSNVVLLIESFDRFSRNNPFAAFKKLSEFIESGITIETIIDQQVYSQESMGNDIGKLYTAVGVLYRAHDESRTKSKRLAEAWQKKREAVDSTPYTSRMPAWLKLNKQTGQISALESPSNTIRKIFQLTINEDMGAGSIARFLNEHIHDYPKFTQPEKRNRNKTRGAPSGWYDSYVKKILNNQSVYGWFQPHRMVDNKRVPAGRPIEDYYPAVVSKSDFHLAQAKIQARKLTGSGRKGAKFSNIFTRLIECKSCGGSVQFMNKGKPPKGSQYLICSNARGNNSCNAPAWRYDDFEETFIKEVVELPLGELLINPNDPHTRTRLLNDIATLKQKLSEIEEESKSVRKLIRRAVSSKSSLSMSGYQEDLNELDNEYEDTKREISSRESELASLESRLKTRTQDEMRDLYEAMKDTDNETDLVSLRRKMNALIRSVVERIVIDNDFSDIPAWERLEKDLPKSLILELEQRGYDTIAKKEAFFESDYGQRLFNEALREIRISFKNGGVRVCRPAKNRSYKMKEKVRTFIENDKKRLAEQTRKFRKKTQVQFERGKEIHETLTDLEELNMLDELNAYMDGLSERDRDALSYYNESIDNLVNDNDK